MLRRRTPLALWKFLLMFTVSVLFSSSCGPSDEPRLGILSGDIRVVIDARSSFVNYTSNGESIGTMTLSGVLFFDQEECPTAPCIVQLASVNIGSFDVFTAPDGRQYANLSILNMNQPSTTIDGSALGTIPPQNATFKVRYYLDGFSSESSFYNLDPIAGVLDTNTGEYHSLFTIINSEGTVLYVTLAGIASLE